MYNSIINNINSSIINNRISKNSVVININNKINNVVDKNVMMMINVLFSILYSSCN